jgi:thioredoxin 1
MDKIKLIKFGHEQCGPCKVMKPILAEIAQEMQDNVEYIDMDTYSMSVEELTRAGIRAVPTLSIMKNDIEVWRHVGMMSKDLIKQYIQKHIDE